MKFKQKIVNFLRRSKKYTQTDMIYLAKGGFWLSLGQVISFISGFLLAIAFANLLPKETYGNYTYVLSIGSILAISTLPGINTALIRTVARGYEGSFIPALKTKIRWGTLSSLASLGLAGYYFLNNNTTLFICFLIVAVFLPLMNSFTIYQAFWNGKKRFDIQTKYNIVIQVISVSALILSLFLSDNLFIVLLVYFISHTVLHFIFLQITIKKIRIVEQKQDSQTISFGKHLSLMSFLESIAQRLDKILIWHFLGPVQLAIYSFAYFPIKELQALFGKTLGPLARPKFSEKTMQDLKAFLPKKIIKIFLLIIPIVVLYIIFVPYIYRIFFPQYLGSIKYSRVLALILLASPLMFLGISLQVQLKKKELYISRFIGDIALIILLIILIPIYQIWGVIVARLLFYSIRGVVVIYLFKKTQ